MKATGIVRRVDDLGRIVIPKNVRTEQGITEGTPMEIFTEDGAVIFKKYATYLEEALNAECSRNHRRSQNVT